MSREDPHSDGPDRRADGGAERPPPGSADQFSDDPENEDAESSGVQPQSTVGPDRTDRPGSEERSDDSETVSLEDFSSIVAHDLRNPLTVARGYLSLIETDDEEHREAVEESLVRAQEIIDDLLTFTRGADRSGSFARTSLESVATSAWNGVETGTATLVVDEDVRFAGDRGAVRQLLENLFRNSIEHGVPDDPTVGMDHVDTDGDGGALREETPLTVRVGSLPAAHPTTDYPNRLGGFYVEDDGVGIPPDERDAVREAGVSRTPGGTGLGLPIIDRFAEHHGWTMTISESDSGGARFEFSGVMLTD